MKTKNRAVEVEYFSPKEAEIFSGLSQWSWRRWAYSGRVASCKVSSRLLIPRTEILRVMAEGYRPALAPSAEQIHVR
jgi:hypothetical protein